MARLRAADGPVLVGPVEIGLLGHHPGSGTAIGSDHFMAVTDVVDGVVHFHDPHGYPFATGEVCMRPTHPASEIGRGARRRGMRREREKEMGRMVETTEVTAPRVPVGNAARPTEQDPIEELKAGLRKLLATLIDRAFGLALDAVEALARTLDEVAARGGLPLNALLGGVRAVAEGRNPIWGAIRGAVAAMSPAAKAGLIAAIVLAVLLLPLTVVLLLLVLIAFAVWVAVQSASS